MRLSTRHFGWLAQMERSRPAEVVVNLEYELDRATTINSKYDVTSTRARQLRVG